MRQLAVALAVLVAAPAAAQPRAQAPAAPVPAAPTPAAPERAPLARRSLADLAYVLGQAHGLEQVCRPESQQWRARMQRLIALEQPSEAFRQQLVRSFNDGHQSAQTRFPLCGAETRRALTRAAGQGRDLARVLAGTP